MEATSLHFHWEIFAERSSQLNLSRRRLGDRSCGVWASMRAATRELVNNVMLRLAEIYHHGKPTMADWLRMAPLEQSKRWLQYKKASTLDDLTRWLDLAT